MNKEDVLEITKEINELGLRRFRLERELREYNQSLCEHDVNYTIDSGTSINDKCSFHCLDCGYSTKDIPDFILIT